MHLVGLKKGENMYKSSCFDRNLFVIFLDSSFYFNQDMYVIFK